MNRGTPMSNSESRKRQTADHRLHPDPDVCALIERGRRKAAAEALREAADDWEMDASDATPRTGAHADAWMRRRADRIEATR